MVSDLRLVAQVKTGDDAQRLDPFAVARLPLDVCERIEAMSGKTLPEWDQAWRDSNSRAIRILAWLVLRQTNAKLRLEEVNCAVGDVTVELFGTCVQCHEDAQVGEVCPDAPEPGGLHAFDEPDPPAAAADSAPGPTSTEESSSTPESTDSES